MAVATMQGAEQHIRSSLGFSILPKDTLTCRLGESNQQPSNTATATHTINLMLYRRLETNNWDHTFIRRLFTEIINQVRSRLIFFISLHTIRLPFETTGDAVCRLFCISLIRLHNSTAWRRHLPFWYWEGIVRISLNQSQSWQIVEESLEVQWWHLTPKVSIQGVRLLHFSDPEALPICYTVNGLHTHTHTHTHTHIFRHQCMQNSSWLYAHMEGCLLSVWVTVMVFLQKAR